LKAIHYTIEYPFFGHYVAILSDKNFDLYLIAI